jgi:hypothetical protein
MVDTIMYGILFVLTLGMSISPAITDETGGVAAESRNADVYRYYSRFSEAK